MRATLAAVALILCFSALAAADPTAGSREEAIAMVKRVQQKFATAGPQATFDAITSSAEFHDRDLYPFVYDTEGWSVAHDGNYVLKEMVAITRGPGSGWVDYKWPNPITHKIQDKSAYVEKLGERYFVGVGIYKP